MKAMLLASLPLSMDGGAGVQHEVRNQSGADVCGADFAQCIEPFSHRSPFQEELSIYFPSACWLMKGSCVRVRLDTIWRRLHR